MVKCVRTCCNSRQYKQAVQAVQLGCIARHTWMGGNMIFGCDLFVMPGGTDGCAVQTGTTHIRGFKWVAVRLLWAQVHSSRVAARWCSMEAVLLVHCLEAVQGNTQSTYSSHSAQRPCSLPYTAPPC